MSRCKLTHWEDANHHIITCVLTLSKLATWRFASPQITFRVDKGGVVPAECT